MTKKHQELRVSPHKPTEKGKSKEMADLKKENHTLKRKISRLQKYLQKVLDKQGESDSTSQEEAVESPAGCPDCKGFNLVQAKLPTGTTIRGCKDCGWKQKLT